MESRNSLHKNLGITLAVAVVLIVGIATYLGERQTSVVTSAPDTTTNVPVAAQPSDDDSAPVAPPVSKPVVVSVPPPAVAPKSAVYAYKNGTYSANGTYMSPGGQDVIAVTLTISNDVITDATVSSVSGDRTSLRYQSRFISGFKQYVVGQKVSSVNLSRVSGSSLTPEGFNAALAQIKAQAKA